MLCDPTWQHSFSQISPPPLGNPCFQWFKFKYNIPFIKFFPPPLGNPCFATLPDNIPFIKFSPPLGNPCFQWFKFKYNIPFIKFFPPLGNPCFQWFKFKYNIPFIKISPPPPWQPMLCDPTWQHSFYQIFPPPLETHAFNDSSSSTTFLLSNFSPPPWQPMLCDPTWQHSFSQISPPPWQPMLSMIQVQVQHSFYKKFPPPPWQPMLSDPTWQHSFYQIFPPPWQPMLSMIQVQVQHSFYQIFSPPLGWAKSKRNILTEWKMKSVIHIDSFLPFLAIGGSCVTLLPPRMFCIAPTTVTEILFCDPTQLLFPINSSEHR